MQVLERVHVYMCTCVCVCVCVREFQENSPFYPHVTCAMIERDVTAGVHSCAILGYFTIATCGHSQCIRAHAAAALYRVTYFSEYA